MTMEMAHVPMDGVGLVYSDTVLVEDKDEVAMEKEVEA
jgi:hypothetical protein